MSGNSSPIEFGQAVLRVRLPIFVDRQWRRHRAASLCEGESLDGAGLPCPLPPGATSPTEEDAYGTYSERSMRYQPPLTEAYVPPLDFVQGKSGASVKQGRGADVTPGQAERVRKRMSDGGGAAQNNYDYLTLDPDGPEIAPELARSVLPLGTYTEWFWRIDAWNLMRWLKLRLSSHAQKEVRAYGEVVLKIFEAWLPACAAAFRTYVLGALTFSQKEVVALINLVAKFENAFDPTCREYGMSAGERAEFAEKVLDLGMDIG